MDSDTKKEVIVTLIKQHRILKNDLLMISKALDVSENCKEEVIISLLSQFKHDLNEHLHLENDTFYFELLMEMKFSSGDLKKTENFISGMEAITDATYEFLEKYTNENVIEDNPVKFRKIFTSIKNLLLVRIDSEEEGVYLLWSIS